MKCLVSNVVFPISLNNLIATEFCHCGKSQLHSRKCALVSRYNPHGVLLLGRVAVIKILVWLSTTANTIIQNLVDAINCGPET